MMRIRIAAAEPDGESAPSSARSPCPAIPAARGSRRDSENGPCRLTASRRTPASPTRTGTGPFRTARSTRPAAPTGCWARRHRCGSRTTPWSSPSRTAGRTRRASAPYGHGFRCSTPFRTAVSSWPTCAGARASTRAPSTTRSANPVCGAGAAPASPWGSTGSRRARRRCRVLRRIRRPARPTPPRHPHRDERRTPLGEPCSPPGRRRTRQPERPPHPALHPNRSTRRPTPSRSARSYASHASARSCHGSPTGA